MPLFWPKVAGECCCGGDCGIIRVTVRTCGGAALISGAVVTVRDEDDNVIGTDTTGSSGVVDIPIPSAATYYVHIIKTGTGQTTRVVAATCSTNALDVTLGRGFHITSGMCLPGEGIAVTITHADGDVYYGVTGPDGTVDIDVNRKTLGQGDYNYSIIGPARSVANTGTLENEFCSLVNYSINPDLAPGYHCHAACFLPLADTLHLTDSIYGSTTLTYSATPPNPISFEGPGWYGEIMGATTCGGGTPGDLKLFYLVKAGAGITPAGLMIATGSVSGGVYNDTYNPIESGAPASTCPPALEFNWLGANQFDSVYQHCGSQPLFTVTE